MKLHNQLPAEHFPLGNSHPRAHKVNTEGPMDWYQTGAIGTALSKQDIFYSLYYLQDLCIYNTGKMFSGEIKK